MILFAPDAISDIERVRDFLDTNNPLAGKRALLTIFAGIERIQDFPDLGRPTGDEQIREIIIRFGGSGYIVRYTSLPGGTDVLVLRIWHGREARL